jgi:hypothetical protein
MAYLLWEGPSVLDGAPIALLATVNSTNGKTGDLVQTYILRADIHPQEAVKTDADSSICGDCRFRGNKGKGRLCYVSLRRGPFGVWNEYAAGKAEPANLKPFGRRRKVRLGTYGDPAAIPFEVWQQLLHGSIGHTGYTHQWRNCDQRFKAIVQASCDYPPDYAEAKALGWHTYRVRLPEEPRFAGERPCPAGKESGAHVTCSDCLGCDGTRRDFVINAHGAEWQVKAYRQFRLTLEAT